MSRVLPLEFSQVNLPDGVRWTATLAGADELAGSAETPALALLELAAAIDGFTSDGGVELIRTARPQTALHLPDASAPTDPTDSGSPS